MLPASSQTGTETPYPSRYQTSWKSAFHDEIQRRLVPGIRVLDVGSGRTPAIDPGRRPSRCVYAGLDISADELALAGPGAYTRTIVGDISVFDPDLADSFDLIVSWQVLEHVKPLSAALANIHGYLVPGGRFIAMFSGKFSLIGLVNSLVPSGFAKASMQKLLGRPADSVFPAHYDRCWAGAIKDETRAWSGVEVTPHFRGAEYLAFSPILQRLYLGYENWAASGTHENLATHYSVTATK